eukprot:3163908-Prymnesium_polylepis.2
MPPVEPILLLLSIFGVSWLLLVAACAPLLSQFALAAPQVSGHRLWAQVFTPQHNFLRERARVPKLQRFNLIHADCRAIPRPMALAQCARARMAYLQQRPQLSSRGRC